MKSLAARFQSGREVPVFVRIGCAVRNEVLSHKAGRSPIRLLVDSGVGWRAAQPGIERANRLSRLSRCEITSPRVPRKPPLPRPAFAPPRTMEDTRGNLRSLNIVVLRT